MTTDPASLADRAGPSAGATPRSEASAGARPRWLLVLAIVLTAVNLRTAVTSVGPVLDELERGLGLGSALAGVLTTLPVLAFAALGAITPSIARRLGERRTLAAALVLMAGGLAVRALAGSA